MREFSSREVDLFLCDAERHGACLDSFPGHLHRLLETRVRAGELISPLPRLYARLSLWAGLSPAQRALFVLRGLRMLHPTWVFCGVSAALAYGLSVSYHLLDTIQVASTSGMRPLHAGHAQSMRVDPEELSAPYEVSGLAVTSPARTVFDCARRLPFREGVAVADSALRLGAVTPEELRTYVTEKRGGYHGIARARAVAAFADARSESGGESLARATMYELGFMVPDLQYVIEDPLDPQRHLRVDFRWELPDGTEILGELDGTEKYVNPAMNGGSPLEALLAERRRESHLSLRQSRLVRFSPADVADREHFEQLLVACGVPKDHEPLIEVTHAGGTGIRAGARRRLRRVSRATAHAKLAGPFWQLEPQNRAHNCQNRPASEPENSSTR